MKYILPIVISRHPSASSATCTGSIGSTVYDAGGKPVKFSEWRKVHQHEPISASGVLKAFE